VAIPEKIVTLPVGNIGVSGRSPDQAVFRCRLCADGNDKTFPVRHLQRLRVNATGGQLADAKQHVLFESDPVLFFLTR
jgi:hypothetical protein